MVRRGSNFRIELADLTWSISMKSDLVQMVFFESEMYLYKDEAVFRETIIMLSNDNRAHLFHGIQYSLQEIYMTKTRIF
jgi:hypothetical protein